MFFSDTSDQLGDWTGDLLMSARMFLAEEGLVEMENTRLEGIKGPPSSEEFVSNLPREHIHSQREGKKECSICLDKLEEVSASTKETVFISLPCSHTFHEECILTWLHNTNSCPVCRDELPTDDPEYEQIRFMKLQIQALDCSQRGLSAC